MKHLLIIKLQKRNDEASELQAILTKHGCIIKTRVGLHDTDGNHCSSEGLIILELIGSDKERNEMMTEIGVLKSIDVKNISI